MFLDTADKDDNEDCLLAERFATSGHIKVIMYVQMFFAILIFIAAFSVFRQLYTNPPAFHCNFKILIINLLIFALIFSFTCIVTTVFTQLGYSFYRGPCELLFKSWMPVLIRAPIYFYIHGVAFLHVILFLERLTATYFCHVYETAAGQSCGFFATIILWTISGGCFLYAFGGENFNNYRTFISSTSPHNAGKVFTLSVVCTVFDICSIFFDYLLYCHNKKMQDNSNVIKWQRYRLRRNYQLRENQRTIQLMLYMSIVHSVIYLTYAISNLIIRMKFEQGDPVYFIILLEACLNIISIHALVMIGILNYYLGFARQKRKFIVEDIYAAKDMYFIQFRQQLEGNSAVRPNFVFP